MLESSVFHRVEFGETDMVGVVFYPNYYRWFDRSTHEFLRLAGYPVARMIDERFATPLAETGARFLAPLRYDDEIDIRARVVEVRARSFRMQHQVWRHDMIVADGYEVRVCVELPLPETGKLTTSALIEELRIVLMAAARVTPSLSCSASTNEPVDVN